MFYQYLYEAFDLFQNCISEGNCGFTRWVDPPIYPHQQYINYLQEHIFYLEREVRSSARDKKDEDNNNDAKEKLCTDPYC
jgi:hypothetical protein